MGGLLVAVISLSFRDPFFRESVNDKYALEDSLPLQFKNPPPAYSILPFWSWNNTLDTTTLQWQMDQMLEKGVNGAFMHARDGLDQSATPYFSEGWWTAIESTVRYAHKSGFQTLLYDEDKWPSGSAGGRTLKVNPERNIKKILSYTQFEFPGNQTIQVNFTNNPLAIFAGKISNQGTYDFSSQLDITRFAGNSWAIPSGRWAIIAFTVLTDPQQQINYLDSATVADFLHTTHDEYYRRLGSYFGNTIPGVFFDEIYANGSDRNNKIFWSDDFLDKFQSTKGYDLKPFLPLLILNDPRHAFPVRYDYFDLVRELYKKAWFRQYDQWTRDHHIWVTGHTTELMGQFNRQADYFNTMGQLQVPCTDNEDFRYGYPRQIDWYAPKQMSSIAHIYGKKRVAAESMGSGGYTIPLEEYRNGFAMLGVYGINLFIPHLFHYSMERPENQADWPPSWFYRNPYWKYFKPLAVYAKRISFMISQGKHVSHVAILYPLTQLWLKGYGATVDDTYYKEVQRILQQQHIDYDILDPSSVMKADCDSNGLLLADEQYKIIVLPDLLATTSGVMQKLSAFTAKGGIVIGLNDLPSITEKGNPGDPVLDSMLIRLFGFRHETLKQHEYYTIDYKGQEDFLVHPLEKGKGIFTRYADRLPAIIKQNIPEDIRIEGKDDEWLKVQHRKAGKRDIFFFVNGHKEKEQYKVSLQNIGKPYRWHPETGDITELSNYRVIRGRLELSLTFEPNEAYFIVLEPLWDRNSGSGQNLLIRQTGLIQPEWIIEEGKLQLQGWTSGETEHQLEYWKGENLVERNWKGKAAPAPIQIEGDWDFQLSPHALDYQWSAVLDVDTVDLPVMKFNWETSIAKNNYYQAAQLDDQAWKQIKVEDPFSNVRGCQRYLSSWRGSWISYYDQSVHLPDIRGGRKYFRKIFRTDGTVKEAYLDITADKKYQLFINGQLWGDAQNWERPDHYDIKKALLPGYNILFVVTEDTHGLLVDGDCQFSNGKVYSLQSNDSWEASNDKVNWLPAFCYADPPLGSWGNLYRPGHSIQFPLIAWYRQVLPPGARSIIRPDIIGPYEMYINGKRIDPGTASQTEITKWLSSGKNILAIKVKVSKGQEGLQKPVRIVCGKTRTPLVPWGEMGLGWYSGRAVYRHTLSIPSSIINPQTKLMINLGTVDHFAEIWINDKLVSYHPWAPFEADISKFVRPGINTVTVVAANLLANEASWNLMDANIDNPPARWWHFGSILREKEKLRAGLLGPVRVTIYVRDSLTLSLDDL